MSNSLKTVLAAKNETKLNLHSVHLSFCWLSPQAFIFACGYAAQLHGVALSVRPVFAVRLRVHIVRCVRHNVLPFNEPFFLLDLSRDLWVLDEVVVSLFLAAAAADADEGDHGARKQGNEGECSGSKKKSQLQLQSLHV